MTCSPRDWSSNGVGFIKCISHDVVFKISERCPKRSHPFVSIGTLENNKKVDNSLMSFDEQIDEKMRGSNVGDEHSISYKVRSKRKYNRKDKNSLWERLHSYGVRLDAVVDWDNILVKPFFINKWSCYKRLDFDNALVKVYKKSILITLRSNQEISHKDILDAERKSLSIIFGVIDLLPSSIVVSKGDVVSLHNAFVNHPTAEFNVNVSVDGEQRLISDNSHGLPEFEAINPKFVVEDSLNLERWHEGRDREALELLNRDVITNAFDLPSVTKTKIDHIVNILDKYATQMDLHLEVEQKTSDTLSSINDSIIFLNSSFKDFKSVSCEKVAGSEVKCVDSNILSKNNAPLTSVPTELSFGESESRGNSLAPILGLPETISFFDVQDRSKDYSLLRAELLRKESGWGEVRW